MSDAVIRTTIAGLSLMLLAGCNEDPDSKAVGDAAVVISVNPVEEGERSYNEILTLLDQVSPDSSAGTAVRTACGQV